MLNHQSGHTAEDAPLTLKDAPHHHSVSRLQPCGTVNHRRSGLACTVFLKRSRMSSPVLQEVLQPQQQKRPASRPARARGRKGSFLRLANRPQSLTERV
jgi:hypothetical protein